jgi:uncharacterized membrane protein YhaH (DUF805 family)
MGFTTAVATCFRKYATFQGRARRSEYWWFTLFNFIITFVLEIVSGMFTVSTPGQPPNTMGAVLLGVYFLATFLPGLAVMVRRLHDTDHSGWWYFIILVPLIGFILLLVWFCSKGTDGPNRYGQDPLGGGVAAVFS